MEVRTLQLPANSGSSTKKFAIREANELMEYALTATKNEARAGSYYDRIARFYDLTFKLNGYGRSLDQYLENHPLPVSRGAKILDAGCGTGLLTWHCYELFGFQCRLPRSI